MGPSTPTAAPEVWRTLVLTHVKADWLRSCRTALALCATVALSWITSSASEGRAELALAREEAEPDQPEAQPIEAGQDEIDDGHEHDPDAGPHAPEQHAARAVGDRKLPRPSVVGRDDQDGPAAIPFYSAFVLPTVL
mgnify:CR=1 FL=1